MRFFNLEGIDKKITQKKEIGNIEKNPSGRLSEKEAVLYQALATESQGIEFSDKADEKFYEEAEILIEKIKSKGFDIDGVDISKIDFSNLDDCEMLSGKIEKIIMQLCLASGDKKISEKINSTIKYSGIKKIVLLLSVFFILSAEAVEAAGNKNNGNFSKQSQEIEVVERKIFNIENSVLIFKYDNKKNPIGIETSTNWVPSKIEDSIRLERLARSLLVENYRMILRGSGRLYWDFDERVLMITCKDIVFNSIYRKELIRRGAKAEADFIEKIILQEVSHEEQILGIEIFNKQVLEKIMKLQ